MATNQEREDLCEFNLSVFQKSSSWVKFTAHLESERKSHGQNLFLCKPKNPGLIPRTPVKVGIGDTWDDMHL